MTRSTPLKHRTPNYRLVTRIDMARPWLPKSARTITTWEPMPLRTDRKDHGVPRL